MSMREKIVQVFSPRVTTVTSDNDESSAAASQRSGISTQSMTTRSRSKAKGTARQPRDSEGFESANETSNWEELNIAEDDGNDSEVDATLTDTEPKTNPGEGPPLTEDERSASEADDINGSPKLTVEPPLNSLKHFTEDHCRAEFHHANADTGVEELVLCGKLHLDCKAHSAKRRKGLVHLPGWYVMVKSKSKHPITKLPIYHGDAEGYYCSDDKLISRRQLDHVKTSDDEYAGEDSAADASSSEGATNSDLGTVADSENGLDGGHQAELDELTLKIELLKREQELLELQAKRAALIKKTQSPSPIKQEPAKKKKERRGAQPTATPIARRKTTKKPPKQVTIGEEHNTSKSPPPNSNIARTLDPALAKTEATPSNADFQAQFIQAFTQATKPLFEQMKTTVDTVAAAAQHLHKAAQAGANHQPNTSFKGSDPPPTIATDILPPTSAPHPVKGAAVVTPDNERTDGASWFQTRPQPVVTPSPKAGAQRDWQLESSDPSTGDEDKIFEMDITGEDIEKAMMPEGLTAGQTKGLYDAMSDVTSLPGTCSATSSSGTNNEQVEVLERMFQSLHASQTTTVISDTGWRTKKRHGLGTIANQEELLTATSKTSKKKDAVFKNQRLLIHRYLRERGYLPTFVDHYINYGLLGRIVRETYDAYLALLCKIREKSFEQQTASWEDSDAATMLEHYSDELWELRSNAADKRMWLFQSYIFLRDSRKKQFQTPKLIDLLMERASAVNTKLAARILKLEATKAEGGGKKIPGKGAGEGDPCPHCKCRELHTFLKVGHTKAECPLKDKAAQWCKKAGKVLNRTLRGGDKRPMDEVIKEISDNWDETKS